MTDRTYQKFVQRWEEVTDLPTQRVGRLTPLYKLTTHYLKVMPWPWLIVGSTIVVVAVYYVIGSAITLLASLLQRGF